MKRAVFSFFPLHTSGNTFPWWDEFPRRIGTCLGKSNIQHLCFYRDYSDSSRYAETERHKVTKRQIGNPFWIYKNLRHYTKNFDRIIFHSHMHPARTTLWILNSRFIKRNYWIITDHDSWQDVKLSSIKRNARRILRNFGLLPDFILGCSKASKNRLQSIYGPKNVRYIYNGTDISTIKTPPELLSCPTNALFVGRLEKYKGLWPLVKAFLLMKDEVDANLTIVGVGPLYEPLRKYIRDNKLENSIKLVGYTRNISEFMRKSHFAVIPSTWEENFPLVSLEAQAHYLPTIYANSGGLPESHINYKTGIMINKNSPEEIIKAVEYFQSDVSRFNEMRLSARWNALNFTIDKMAKDYCKLYMGLFEK